MERKGLDLIGIGLDLEMGFGMGLWEGMADGK